MADYVIIIHRLGERALRVGAVEVQVWGISRDGRQCFLDSIHSKSTQRENIMKCVSHFVYYAVLLQKIQTTAFSAIEFYVLSNCPKNMFY